MWVYDELALTEDIIALARQYGRYGYRLVTAWASSSKAPALLGEDVADATPMQGDDLSAVSSGHDFQFSMDKVSQLARLCDERPVSKGCLQPRRREMLKTIAVPAISVALALGVTSNARAETMMYEEMKAHQEERLILTSPIAGIENHLWFDYRVGVLETKKELSSDLRRASDTEDLRDAWDEYAHELAHERRHYVKKMEKRGFRQGQVIVG